MTDSLAPRKDGAGECADTRYRSALMNSLKGCALFLVHAPESERHYHSVQLAALLLVLEVAVDSQHEAWQDFFGEVHELLFWKDERAAGFYVLRRLFSVVCEHDPDPTPPDERQATVWLHLFAATG